MTRLADARTRLAALVCKWQGRRFRWGASDCCQFAARAVNAVDGRDPREIFPAYRTRAQAEGILEASGGIEGLARKALAGFPEIHPSRAGYGDIVLSDFGRGPQPAVCVGVYCVAPGRRGLERRMTLNAIAAWKI